MPPPFAASEEISSESEEEDEEAEEEAEDEEAELEGAGFPVSRRRARPSCAPSCPRSP